MPTPNLADPLPDRLRHATRVLHARAERSGAMAALLGGRLPRARYVALLRSLHPLYAALEAALDARRADPRVAPLREPALYRRAALEDDLNVLHGSGWRHETAAAPAALAYAARLHALAGRDDAALGAHAYVRYLGDLHGGQVLARVVARAYALPERAGTAFYRFGGAAEVQQRRDALRAALGALPLNAVEADGMLAEACWGFEQHVRLFEELAAG